MWPLVRLYTGNNYGIGAWTCSSRQKLFEAYLEGEHELVALKQAEAGVVVHIKGQRLNNVAQTSLQAGSLHEILTRFQQHGRSLLQMQLSG